MFFLFSDEFLRSHMPNTESVFKGEFIVLEGDFLPQGAVQIGSYVHVQKSRFYQQAEKHATSNKHNKKHVVQRFSDPKVTKHQPLGSQQSSFFLVL